MPSTLIPGLPKDCVCVWGEWSRPRPCVAPTYLPHLLAQAPEYDVPKGVRGSLLNVPPGVPLLVRKGLRPTGLVPVLLACVAAGAHHLPRRAPTSCPCTIPVVTASIAPPKPKTMGVLC